MRVRHGANAASDDYLVVEKLQLKLRKYGIVRMKWKCIYMVCLQDLITQQHYQQKLLTNTHDRSRDIRRSIEDERKVVIKDFMTLLEERDY